MANWLWMSGVNGPPYNNGWFELIDVQISAFRVPPEGFRGGRGRGSDVSTVSAASFTVSYDSSVAEIAHKFAQGHEIPSAVVFREPQTEIKMTQCVIDSMSTSGNPPITIFSLQYSKIEFHYTGEP